MSDLISRQAAIDALDVLCQEHRYKIPGKMETYSQYNEAWQDALNRAEGAIGNLPSAQPMRKKGRWIADNYGNTICSECRWYAPKIMQGSLTTRKLEYYKSDFCWKCGADMRGETGCD